ncbi:MAG: MFS transporter [Negativicutes bacterium]|nr:MFS transporter [Negativicutes bacterium]
MATITERLSSLPLSRFHYRMLLILAFGVACEALDTGIVAFVLAKMIGSWNLSSAQIGYIGSMGLVGMACGAILSGTLADRIGRKKMFIATTVMYCLGTGLCGLAWNYESLLAFRFIVGAGVGGQPPVAMAMMGEFAPPRHRGKMLVVVNAGWAFGWLTASVLAYTVIPVYGWQIAFFIGALPVLVVPYLLRALPESPMYLVSKGRLDEAHAVVAAIEREIGVPVGQPPKALPQTAAPKSFSFLELWSEPFLRKTVCLWILWFGMVYAYYGMFTWLPSLLVKSGHTLVRSFEYLIWMTMVQIPGYFTAAYLVDRIGRKATMGSFLVICTFAAYMFGNAKTGAEIITWGCVLSFFNLGAWGITHTYSSEQYPTYARASGVGFAAAFGRCGGIIAPIVVGAIMTEPDKVNAVFMMFTIVLGIVAANILLLGQETMNKSLDELTEKRGAPTPTPAATKTAD